MFEGLRFCWVGQRGSDILGLHEYIDFAAVICCDYGQTGKYIETVLNIPVFSLERSTGVRQKWSSLSLDLALNNVLNSPSDIAALSSYKELFLIPYANVLTLELLAEHQANWHLLAPSLKLRELFDNKIVLRGHLASLGLPIVPGDIIDPSFYSFDILSRRLGTPFVLQLAYGSSGSGTFLIREPSDLSAVAPMVAPGDRVAVLQYQDGYSLNINAVVTHQGVVVSQPSVQIVGVDVCTDHPLGYCGNDYSAIEDVPEKVVQECYSQTYTLGKYMAQKGYLGLFGVDFITNSCGQIYPVEINARFQNSTALLTNLLAAQQQPPLSLLHIATFLQSTFPPATSYPSIPIVGA